MSRGGGIGESRIFKDPASNPELNDCHLNGERIGDLVAAGKIDAGKLVYAMTDEGIAERVAEMAGKPRPSVQVLRSEEDKKMYDHRADMLADDDLFPAAPNPLKELMDKHTPPGFVGMWLGDAASKHLTDCGYERVKDKDGQPVRLGDLALGIKPVEEHQRMLRAIDKFSRSQEEEIHQTWSEKIEEGYAEVGKRAPRTRPNDPDSGIQEDRVDLQHLETNLR